MNDTGVERALEGEAAADEESAETSELALASLGLSIVWLFGLGSLAGIYLARRSLREIRESEGAIGGRTLAIAGLVTGFLGLGSTVLVIQFFLSAN